MGAGANNVAADLILLSLNLETQTLVYVIQGRKNSVKPVFGDVLGMVAI